MSVLVRRKDAGYPAGKLVSNVNEEQGGDGPRLPLRLSPRRVIIVGAAVCRLMRR